MQKLYKELSSHYRQVSHFLTDTAAEVAALDKIFRAHGVKRVLDVACGVGRHSVPLAKMGYEVTGIDYSKDQLRQARKLARVERADVTFLLKDANRFHSRKKFDAAICMWTTIGEEPMVYGEVMRNVREVLRKGGIFILDNNTWSHIPKSGEEFIRSDMRFGRKRVRQTIHDRFTEHFRIREARVTIGGKTYEDLCLTHVKTPAEWGRELVKAGFRRFEIKRNYRIRSGRHRKSNALIIGVK